MKVCVTGADGFIGSHLVCRLLKSGHKVRALVQYNARGSHGWLEDLSKAELSEIEVVAGDVRDSAQMRTLMQGIEEVYHLAALIAIPYSYHAPESYVQVNTLGTLHVLQGALDAGASRVLVASTSEVYGTARSVPMSESHPFQAQSPYAASKIAADRLAESFWHSFGLPVTIVRPFNTYGPRQSARAVIPSIIGQMLSGRNPIRLGDLRPSRDFVFVTDTVEAFDRLARTPAAIGREVNVATGNEITIGGLAQTLALLIAPETRIETDPERMRPPDSEVFRLQGDATLLQQLTGWQPGVSLTEGLTHTLNWYREFVGRGGSLHADRYIL